MKKQIIQYSSAYDQQLMTAYHYVVSKPKALVVVFHGMAEHQERYVDLANAWTQAGYDVLTMDHRGHGKSLFDGSLKGYFADEDGWRRNLGDIHAIVEQINPNSKYPVILLGHSMGSLFARSYLKHYPDNVIGMLLSGSPDESPLAAVGLNLAKVIALLFGKKHPSPLLTKMSFGSFNKAIENPKSSMDWLSVDADNVRTYVADPLCGFDFTAQGFVDMLEGMHEVYEPKPWNVLNSKLPIQFFSGKLDPCWQPSGLEKAVAALKSQGYPNISFEYLDGVRHEILNDFGKEALTLRIITWMDALLPNK